MCKDSGEVQILAAVCKLYTSGTEPTAPEVKGGMLAVTFKQYI